MTQKIVQRSRKPRQGSEDPKAETQFVHQSKVETQCVSKLKDEFKIEMQSKPRENYIVK